MNKTGYQKNPNRERGEDRWSAKLTEDNVRFIRNSNAKNASLAAEFGVSEGTIEHVKHRRTWAHIL